MNIFGDGARVALSIEQLSKVSAKHENDYG